MSQESLIIGNLRIDEPVTTLTDLLVSAVCLYAYAKLRKKSTADIKDRLLQYYFLGMALSTFVGGIAGHAFYYALGPYWKLPGWFASMISVTLLERVMIMRAAIFLPKHWTSFLSKLNLLEMLTFMALTLGAINANPDNFQAAFHYVEIHSAYGILLVVGTLSAYYYAKTKSKAAVSFLAGVGLGAVAAGVFISKFSIHDYFNHIDLAHVFMAAAALYFMKGGLLFMDETPLAENR